MTSNRRDFLTSMTGVAGLSMVSAPMAFAATATAAASAPYKNASLPVDRRVSDLLGRMTLEEKIAQMLCVWQKKTEIQDASGEFNAAKAKQVYPHGIGMIGRPSDRQLGQAAGAGDTGGVKNRNALETAIYTNAAQKWAVEETRLGIPLFMHEEALHGYVARDATSFPQAIGLASSSDPALVQQAFSVAAREMRARGANLALAPVVDVAREPRWGRIEETYGEDAHLSAEIGKAAVIGFAGDNPVLAKDKVFVTLKHLSLIHISEPTRPY